MSDSRDELIEIIARDPISSGGDAIWAADLVDAYRAEVLREAAEKLRKEAEEPLVPEWWRRGVHSAADLIDPDPDTP